MFVRTEEQETLAAAVREWCESEIRPTAKADDEAEFFRKDLIHRMGEQGFCGVPTEADFGGLGLGYLDYAIVLEEIGRVSASYGVSVAVTGLPQVILRQFGSDEQKNRFLPGLASGQLLGAFALSEPDSGSDAGSLRTTAEKHGNTYVLRGTKYWITHGGYADVYVVMARTGGPGPAGVSAFLVEGDRPGLSAGKKEEKMGLRASPTAEILLDGVEIPEENRLGPEGIGFTVAMAALDSGRITIGAISIGLCHAALEVAARYATVRKQFDTPIIDFQGVGFMLADMAVRTDAAELMVHRAAWLRDNGRKYSMEAAMAKLAATDAAMAVTTDAVQALGGYGYTRDYPVERFMRDAKVMQIVEGTNQVQRLVVSRHLKRRYGGGI
jgi:alkylation response protein AidB-like acyl-CoA dehydrogenase